MIKLALAFARAVTGFAIGRRPSPSETPSPAPEPPPPHPEPYYAEKEESMPTKEATPAKPARIKKPNAKPLTQRCWEGLTKHGPATADALARRVGATSLAVSKALAATKRRGLTTFRRTKKGENVHSAKGKAWPPK